MVLYLRQPAIAPSISLTNVKVQADLFQGVEEQDWVLVEGGNWFFHMKKLVLSYGVLQHQWIFRFLWS